MSRDKQIKEMAEIIRYANGKADYEAAYFTPDANMLYDAGYRKASDIIEEIEEHFNDRVRRGYIGNVSVIFAELKKKYESEDFIPAPPHTCPHIIPNTIESIADLAFPESEGVG